jgi:hypothetical protein
MMLAESIKKVETIAKMTADKVDKLIVKGKEKIDSGTRVVGECGDSLEEVLVNVVKVNEMMNEISVASEEQSQGIIEITKAMAQLDHVTQKNSTAAQSSSLSSKELQQEAEKLHEIVALMVSFVEGDGKVAAPKKNNEARKKTPKVVNKAEESSKSISSSVKNDKVVQLHKNKPKRIIESSMLRASGGDADTPKASDPRFEEI